MLSYIEDRRDAPYEPGTNDCAAFVRGAVIAMTGEDPCPDLRWSTAEEADALLAQGLEQLVTARLGDPVPVLCVPRYGVLLIDHGRAVALNVGGLGCLPGAFTEYDQTGKGEARRVFRHEVEGLVFLPLSRFVKGWRIG